ncbi:N-acetyltransferase [Chitiniphilus shinanonensis]|nr:N-acetyltransferase [Chitiniphilus shinanonensis]
MPEEEVAMTHNPNSTDQHSLFRQASDPDTSVQVLARLAGAEDEVIRAAVAFNAATPKPVLDALLADPSEYVRDCVTKRILQTVSALRVHPTAIVSNEARIGENVVIGAYTIVRGNVSIGDGTVIESHCEIGHPAHTALDEPLLHIGRNSFIRSHSIFYEGSTFGDNLVTGHRVTVREKTKAGRNMQIGTLSDIQGHCEIGDFVRLHSNVHIGQHARIKDYVWIFPYVVLTNDPHPPSNVMLSVTLENYVAVATMSVVLPGVTVKEGALVGAHSAVARDVEPDTVVAGSPAKYICDTSNILLKDGSGRSAYPWRRHFHRGYLPDTVAKWMAEFAGRPGLN